MIGNEENSRGSNIPDNNQSKAMDSKRDVEQSPDEKTDQDFPGYPHYPAKEDIMDQRTGAHRVDADLENMGTGPNATGVNQRFLAGQDTDRSQTNQVHRQDASNDMNETDGNNEEIGIPQNVSNDELNSNSDLPGTDLDSASGGEDR
jgi:hypothetical protein